MIKQNSVRHHQIIFILQCESVYFSFGLFVVEEDISFYFQANNNSKGGEKKESCKDFLMRYERIKCPNHLVVL